MDMKSTLLVCLSSLLLYLSACSNCGAIGKAIGAQEIGLGVEAERLHESSSSDRWIQTRRLQEQTLNTCVASTRAGMKCMVSLRGVDDYLLHWNRVNDTISFVADVATTGWVAVGFSANGEMPGTIAIIGNKDGEAGAAAHRIVGYSRSAILDLDLKLKDVTVATNDGRTVLSFSLTVSEANVIPMFEVVGPLTMSWSFSSDGSTELLYHMDNKGLFSINLAATPAAAASPPPPPSSPRGPNDCQASSLPGYDCSVDLDGQNFILHWTYSANSVSYAADTAASGWFGIGWSPSGQMKDSEAVIADVSNGSQVQPYFLAEEDLSSVKPTSKFVISDASLVAANGRKIAKFSRTFASDDYVGLNRNGFTLIIWATSQTGSSDLHYHGNNRGLTRINFVSGLTLVEDERPSKSALQAHGWLMAIAFALLMPAAVIVSRLFVAGSHEEKESAAAAGEEGGLNERKLLSPAVGFSVHVGLQLLSVALIIVAIVLAYTESHRDIISFTHGQVALSLFLFLPIQVLLGAFRPSHDSPLRSKWWFAHLLVGFVVLSLGWTNLFLGLEEYDEFYDSVSSIAYVILGLFLAIVGVLYLMATFYPTFSSYVFPKSSTTGALSFKRFDQGVEL